ncbi:MAG TPA: hypothetical protein VFQ61_23325 [Polyangiaceae bacterium]|nr:hypothetical protein [Polyangiaceae bacterium]
MSKVRCKIMAICALFAAAGLSTSQEAKAEPHLHDGFYLQLATGVGYYNSSAEAGANKVGFSGATLPFSLMLGGSPIPGLAIGGSLMIDYAPSPRYKINGQTFDSGLDISQYVIGLGPSVDFYPDPSGGLHFQGFVGWGGLETSADGNAGGSDPTGLLLAVGAGYDFWVGNEWSIGGLGRLTYAPLSMNDVTYSTIEPALLATFTYH